MRGISRITVAAAILLAVLLNCGCNAMYARPLPVSSAEQSVSAISESAAEEISSDETAPDKSETSGESADSPEEQSAGGDNAADSTQSTASSESPPLEEQESTQPPETALSAQSVPDATTDVQTVSTRRGSSVRIPYAAGTVTYSGGGATIDASNASQGYVMCAYDGFSSRSKVQITRSGGSTYTYDLNTAGRYEAFPFSMGSGSYTVNIYENVGGSSYSLCVGETIDVSLDWAMLPFLYANQFVNFQSGSVTVATSNELARNAASDLQVVENIYNYVINNLSYDYNKASTVTSGYLPVLDSILTSGYGICFDYAALMTAMLRTQSIPTKLVIGYAGDIYHAWISAYITDVGWVDGIIYFDGQSWKRMDPTFADNGGQSADIMAFIENNANYSAVYVY